MSCVRFVLLLFSLGASAAALGLYRIGAHNRWSSDGPGMLLIMLALGVCALAALAGWGSLLASLGISDEDEGPRRVGLVDFEDEP